MKIKNILLYIFTGITALLVISCEDYLSTLPDNRADIDSKDKIRKLLTSAYPETAYIMMAELSSDNIDDYGVNNPYSDRFHEQVAYWEDVTENDNEAPYYLWSSLYMAIANANQALESITEMGDTDDLQALKGEALLCRAYSHFILTNLFCQHYNTQTSDTDMGIPYIDAPENELNPQYERGTVAENYKRMNEDIEKGLPLINDSEYSIVKYHFNRNAAYAFASRFNLYYQKWDKVIEYANKVLPSNAGTMLRDMQALSQMTRDEDVYSLEYIKEGNKTNLLLMTAYSSLGVYFGAYYTGSRFSHGSTVAKETSQSKGQWGMYNNFYVSPFIYTGTNLNKTLSIKFPYIFEMTDPVSQTGFHRTVYPAFTAEEVLFNRAEAYVMEREYQKAVDDISAWKNVYMKTSTALTIENINTFYNGIKYYTPADATVKKRLSPDFTFVDEIQENLIHCILHARRIVTLHEGLRWFDIKRYGIEIERRVIDAKGAITVAATLPVNDERRAFQLPQEVISAGLTPNPRTK